MNKNIDAIEEIMRDSYQLHKVSQHQTTKELSLEIASNIHEVKKDYIRVIDGLNEITGDNFKDDQPIALNELIDILLINTKEYSDQLNKTINLTIDNRSSNLPIKKHYFFISILRNLMNNAIESIRKYGTIHLTLSESPNYLIIQIKDNGIGIKEKNLAYVFNFGYSTKFKDGDGKSQRGIGLSLVKKLVETKFDGTIDLDSVYGDSTTFQLKLSKETL
jgi:two-component system sensor histidine kinase YcbA